MPLGDVALHLVEDWEDAVEFKSWLSRRRDVLAVDTETGGFNWWKDPLRLVQFGDTESGWAVPWDEWRGLTKEALGRYTDPLCFHNMKFDIHYLEHNGCKVNRSQVHDTRPMAHILDPIGRTGLKELARNHVDEDADGGQADLKKAMAKNGWTWATVPIDFYPYWIYAALDTVLTAHLYQQFSPQMSDFRRVYDLEIASSLVLVDMEKRGARIDVDYCERKMAELSEYVDEMAVWCKDTYNVSPGSNPAVAGRLLADGVRLEAKTDTGGWSMTAEVLEAIDHPLAEAVVNRRKAQKIASSYFGNLLEFRDGDIIHPDINPLGARTGRMSASRPALQQMSRGRLVRDAFIARDGNKLMDNDFNQVELRLLAHFADEAGMIQAFAEADAGGVDVFTAMARTIYGDPDLQKTDDRRQHTKFAAYANAYGAGTERFAWTAHIDVAEAEQFLKVYHSTFPGVKRWQRAIDRVANERMADEGVPYVTTAWGRRQVVEWVDWAYKLGNYLIQGTSADLIKQKLVDLDSAGLAQYIVLPVHDEFLSDVPEADLAEVQPEFVKVMQELEMFKVPLTCGSDVGDTWGEIH